MLFYMSRSSASFEKQVEHNLRQAKGYLRLWATGNRHYTLIGTNRAEGKINIPFGRARSITIVSLISSDTAFSQHAFPGTFSGPKWCISLDEKVVAALASFGGTPVDLLALGSMLRQEGTSLEWPTVTRVIDRYCQESGQIPIQSPLRRMFASFSHFEAQLERTKAGVNSSIDLGEAFSVLGDLSLADRWRIIHGACQAFQASGQFFENWAALGVMGDLYSFMVVCAPVAANSSLKAQQLIAARQKEVNEQYGRRHWITFWWGYMRFMEGIDPTALTFIASEPLPTPSQYGTKIAAIASV